MTPNVTEHEMREFFNRLISTIVEGTRTHEQLTALEIRFKTTEERVQSLVSELAQARQELYTTVTERDKARKEAQDNQSLATSYANDLEHTRSELTAANDQLRNLGVQLADSGRELEKTKTELANTQTELNHTRDDQQYWRKRAFDAETTVSEVRKAYEDLHKKWKSMTEFFEGMFHKEEKEPAPLPPVNTPYQSPEPSPGVEGYKNFEDDRQEVIDTYNQYLSDGSKNPNYRGY